MAPCPATGQEVLWCDKLQDSVSENTHRRAGPSDHASPMAYHSRGLASFTRMHKICIIFTLTSCIGVDPADRPTASLLLSPVSAITYTHRCAYVPEVRTAGVLCSRHGQLPQGCREASAGCCGCVAPQVSADPCVRLCIIALSSGRLSLETPLHQHVQGKLSMLLEIPALDALRGLEYHTACSALQSAAKLCAVCSDKLIGF